MNSYGLVSKDLCIDENGVVAPFCFTSLSAWNISCDEEEERRVEGKKCFKHTNHLGKEWIYCEEVKTVCTIVSAHNTK